MRHHFENAADRISRSQHLVDFLFHLLFSFGIGAIQQNLVTLRKSANLFP